MSGARALFAGALAVVAAECVVAFVDPLPGAVAHAAVLVALVSAHALTRPGAADEAVLRATIALALVPLARLISLALVIDDRVWALALVGAPVALALGLALRATGAAGMLAARGEGRPWAALLLALLGLPLGLVAYLILEPPEPVDPAPVLAAAVVASFLFGGVLEELLFRGILQRDLAAALGRAGIPLACLLYAAVYLGSGSRDFTALHALLGVALAVARQSTGSVAGPALAHGVMTSSLLMLWPVVL